MLPFDNISSSADDAYFAAGITEEITGQLSRLGGLRVVSSTAVAQAVAGGGSLAEIADELNVTTLLDGSVRKAGEQVRISAQLVDPRSNENLWSQDFDRDMSDIFAIQSEVARAIVRALDARLSPEEERRLDDRPTDNVVAYNLYLRAIEKPGSQPDENAIAIELLEQAVAIDSQFVEAWGELSFHYTWKELGSGGSGLDTAFVLAEHALSLDSLISMSRFALGTALWIAGRPKLAIREFERVLDYDPSYRGALHNGSYAMALAGQLARAVDVISRALPVNPNVPNTRAHVGFTLMLLGNDDRTEAWLELAASEGMTLSRLDLLRIDHDIARGRRQSAIGRITNGLEQHLGSFEFEGMAADALFFLGEPDRALAIIESRFRLTPTSRPNFSITGRSYRTIYAFLLHQGGETARAAALFDETLSHKYAQVEQGSEWSQDRNEIAAIHAVRGDTAEALRWLQQGYEVGYRRARILAQDPMFGSLRGNEEFQALLSRMAEEVAREDQRVEVEGLASVIHSMIVAGGIRDEGSND